MTTNFFNKYSYTITEKGMWHEVRLDLRISQVGDCDYNIVALECKRLKENIFCRFSTFVCVCNLR